MSVDYIKEIEELNKDKVHIQNRETVNDLISKIVKRGTGSLQIVSDFDKTLTKHHESGKRYLSSFGMFQHCQSLPSDYMDSVNKMSRKYVPVELDPSIPYEQKRQLMEEWWTLSEQALRGLSVPQTEIEEAIKRIGPPLRDGTDTLLSDLNKAGVPVLVFSAGLGDTVVAVLKHCNVLLSNVKVVSNFLKYDEQGIIQGFQAAPIHIFNKNEYALKGTDYYDMVQSRDNVILMGDSVGDAGMADGMEHANAVLKIGFIHDHVEESLPLYMDKFDIVLEDDQTMNVIRAILSYVL